MFSTRRATDSLRAILFAIPLVVVLIGGFGYWVLNWTSDRIIARQAERVSLAWAKELGAELNRIEEIAAGAPLTQEEISILRRTSRVGDVFLFKLFDGEGRLKLASDALGKASSDGSDLTTHNEKAARVLAAGGQPFTAVEDGSNKPDRPDVYVESYVPIERDGRIVAVVEVYVDQTGAAGIVRADFFGFGLQVAGLTLLALLLPAVAVLIMSRALRQRNQALEAERARASAAEDRLLQAQKLKAVGQLTGGVAHDFNNLLAVIQGNAELLSDHFGGDHPMTGAILRASDRGAELTQRLLAFSRRQPLHPQRIDLAQMVEGLSEMLTRTLGATIQIQTVAAADLHPAFADPGQVESALLNLAINARDAMPDGGRLVIECQNATISPSDADPEP